jgi:hypothetical protein
VLAEAAGQDIDTVREVRDQIRHHIEQLIDELLPS